MPAPDDGPPVVIIKGFFFGDHAPYSHKPTKNSSPMNNKSIIPLRNLGTRKQWLFEAAGIILCAAALVIALIIL